MTDSANFSNPANPTPAEPERNLQSNQTAMFFRPNQATAAAPVQAVTDQVSTPATEVPQPPVFADQAAVPVEPQFAQPTGEQTQTSTEPIDDQPTEPDMAEYFGDVAPRPVPEETVFEWFAMSRPFRKHHRQYYVTIAIILVIICAIFFFFQQFILIGVALSLAFLRYVLSAFPPEQVHFKITNYGLRIDKQLYYWDELGRFWLSKADGFDQVNVEVSRFPFRLSMLLGDKSPEMIQYVLGYVLLEQKPEPTTFEKAAEWLQSKIPLEPPEETPAT